MTNMLSYSQRIQLALLVLFASFCLNFGRLLAGMHRPSQQAGLTRSLNLPGG